TCGSEGTGGFRSFATASARRNVSSKQTSALFRIADCRLAYSSMRSARNGGENGTGAAPVKKISLYEKKNAREVGSINQKRPPGGTPNPAKTSAPPRPSAQSSPNAVLT